MVVGLSFGFASPPTAEPIGDNDSHGAGDYLASSDQKAVKLLSAGLLSCEIE